MADAVAATVGDVRLLVAQVSYHWRLYWRIPVATFFTMALPVILLVLLDSALGKGPEILLGMPTARFYVPSIAVYGIAGMCYSYLSVATVMQKESGVLKRLRGTPLPTWIFLAGHLICTALLALLSAALVLSIGYYGYGVHIIPERIPAAALTLVVGIFSFAALGMGLAALVRTGEGAQALSNATLLPLAFISDVFVVPTGEMPRWLVLLADLFPLKHFAAAFARAFDPRYSGDGLGWATASIQYAVLPHLAVLLAWGVAGVAIAAIYFRSDAPHRRAGS